MNIPIPDLKKKMESLMGSYRREKSREKKSRLTGSGRDDVYKSSWFAYNAFAFMSDRNEPGTTRDTMENNETDTNDETVSATQLAQDPSPDNDNIQVMENQQQQDDTNNTQFRVGTQDQRSRKRSKKRPAKDTDDLSDETLSEAFRILQQCAEPQPAPQPPCDSYSAFGQYIANELRNYDPVTLAHVKKDICAIIFQANTGAYQQYGYYTQNYARSMQHPSSHASSYTDPMSPSPLPPQPAITSFPMTSPIQSEIPLPPSPPMTSQNPSEIPPPPSPPMTSQNPSEIPPPPSPPMTSQNPSEIPPPPLPPKYTKT
ncbi:uncharacterized protein LOC132903897 [Amyelois transitella]|nr:uncharacterized protein LOC132903084 [Amyelois transitella]XP_060809359.1 uncharacterized protein LOC132903897 [Amyelois transitella]